MFLATTALTEFWDKEREILFLGSWCRPHGRRAEWEGLRGQVLPSPWDDRERFYDAVRDLEDHYERILSRIGEYLNRAHGSSYGAAYWRIVLGPWLMHLLHAAYDRYVHLQHAFQADPRLETRMLDPGSFRVPRDGAEAFDLLMEDPYNLQVVTQLLEGMGHAFPKSGFPASAQEVSGVPHKANTLRRLARSSERLMGRLFQGRWQVALCHTDLPAAFLWRLAVRSGMRALPLPLKDRFPIRARAVFNTARNGLAGLPSEGEFERCFIRSLPWNLPVLYLEGFAEAREETLRRVGRAPMALLSSVGWYFHEPFQFLAAEAKERGRRLLSAQHGGGYGLHRSSPQERHERRVADLFLAWGWADPEEKRMRNIPSPKLSALFGTGWPIPAKGPDTARKPSRASGLRPLLFVPTINPRYVYRFYSTPQGTQLEEYFTWQVRFLKALPVSLRQRVRFRPHPQDFGHGWWDRLREELPWLRRDSSPSFQKALLDSCVAVMDHPGTSMLESLAANVPTLLFWDPNRWETRPEAGPEMEGLRQAGILLSSPEEAARRVARWMDSPRSWIEDPAVQAARRRFLDRQGWMDSRWTQAWADLLTRRPLRAAQFLLQASQDYLFPGGPRRFIGTLRRRIRQRRRTTERSVQINDTATERYEKDLLSLPPEERYACMVYRKGLRSFVLQDDQIVHDEWMPVERVMHEAVARAMGLEPGSSARVLELGCSSGRNLFWLKRNYPGVSAFGADVAGRSIQLGQRMAGDFGCDVQFTLLNDSHLPFPDGYFDCSFTKFCLEQCPLSYPELIRELLRVTRKRVILLEPMEQLIPFSLRGLLVRLHGFYQDYSRGLYSHVRKNARIVRAGRMRWAMNPLNEPSLVVMEK